MNSLGIDLEEGQKVLMEGDCDVSLRTVTVEGGFGMVTCTSGTALFATDCNGQPIRLNAMEIEKLVEQKDASV